MQNLIEENKVWELCPACETEVFIVSDRISSCPNCGKDIIPCSMCSNCIASAKHCPVWKVSAL